MADKVIKKTQDTLGKVIKKPPLTEKLLGKPPFRFLHDIMTSVIKTTGFMKGLFADNEMSSENVKDKESKIAFLQKAIDMVSLVMGRSVSARPSKVVAGHEPEKTNEFLQLLAEAVNKKVDNAEYVERVLGGDSGGGGKKEREKPPSGSRDKRESSADRRKRKEKEEDGEKGHRSKREDKDREDRKDRGKGRDRERDKDRDQDRDKDKDRGDKHRDRDRSKDRQSSKDRDRDKDKERHHRDRDRDRSRDKGEDREKDRERRKRKESKTEAEQGEADTPQLNGDVSEENVKKERRSEKPRKDEDVKEERVSKKREETTMNGHVGEEDAPPPPEQSRGRSRMVRPSSARPAPPRVKKSEPEPQEVHIVGQSNAPNVIVDKKGDDTDDDDFITKEDAPLVLAEEPPPPTTYNDADEEGGEHGGLVKKILVTKKELEGGSLTQQGKTGKKTEIERSHMTDATKRKEREMVQKEIDKLRAAIQLLTRSANPLGKIMDFVQEDLDSMQKELEMWTRENKDNVVSLQREERITESSVEPLKAQLMELDSAIGDQLDLIAAVKANIIRNDDKIEKMLSTTTKS